MCATCECKDVAWVKLSLTEFSRDRKTSYGVTDLAYCIDTHV